MSEKKITCYLCGKEINTNAYCIIHLEEELVAEEVVCTLTGKSYYFCLKCYFRYVWKKEYIFKDFGEY